MVAVKSPVLNKLAYGNRRLPYSTHLGVTCQAFTRCGAAISLGPDRRQQQRQALRMNRQQPFCHSSRFVTPPEFPFRIRCRLGTVRLPDQPENGMHVVAMTASTFQRSVESHRPFSSACPRPEGSRRRGGLGPCRGGAMSSNRPNASSAA